MKTAKLLSALSALTLAITLTACGDGNTITDPTNTAYTDAVSALTGVSAGTIPLDGFSGLAFQTVQDSLDNTATKLVYETGSVTNYDTAGNMITTSTSTVLKEDTDGDGVADTVWTDTNNDPSLYFDVYVAENADDVAALDGTSIVYQSGQITEEAGKAVNVTLATICTKLGVSSLKVGQTYYWRVQVKNHVGTILADATDSFKIYPPRNYGAFTLGADFNGRYLTTSFPATTNIDYSSTIADLYFYDYTTTTDATTNVTDVTKVKTAYAADCDLICAGPGEAATLKYYFPSNVALTAGGTYYAYLSTKDAAYATSDFTGKSAGLVKSVVAPASFSIESLWNVNVGKVALNNTESTPLTARPTAFTFNNLAPSTDTQTTYTVYYGTAANPTTVLKGTLAGPTSGVYTFTPTDNKVFSLGTAYYLTISVLWNDGKNASVPTADRTETVSVQFTTPAVSSNWEIYASEKATLSATEWKNTLSETATTITGRSDVYLSWNELDISLLGGDSFTYAVFFGKSASALTRYTNNAIVDNGTRDSLKINRNDLAVGTTYYARIDASYKNTSNVYVTVSSPVVAFTTPSRVATYTFDLDDLGTTEDGDNNYNLSATPQTNPEIYDIYTTATVDASTVLNYGNGAPALHLAGTETIKTALDASANTYRSATVSLDYKLDSISGAGWRILFNDQDNDTTYNPAFYSTTTPSLNYAQLKGPIIQLELLADDSTTTTINEKAYRVVMYHLVADNTIDIDPTTIGTQGDDDDGDLSPNGIEFPDVQRTVLGVLNVDYGWHTIAATITTDGSTPNVTIKIDNQTTVTQSIAYFAGIGDKNSVIETGIDQMVFTANDGMLVDNVSYTVNDATYTRSVR